MKKPPLDAVGLLAEAVRFVECEHPLPRCKHGKALADHSGELLAASCGCRISQEAADSALGIKRQKETP